MNLGVGGPIDFANLGAGGSKILKNPGAGGSNVRGGGSSPPGDFLMEQP